MVSSSMKRKCLPYRKPGQTRRTIQRSYNTPSKPFQSWSTIITSDSRMIIRKQNTSKWFSHVKLPPINRVVAEVFHSKEKFANPTYSSRITLFVWHVCLIDTSLATRHSSKNRLIWFCDSSFLRNYSHLRIWKIKLNLTMLKKITIWQSASMCWSTIDPLIKNLVGAYL